MTLNVMADKLVGMHPQAAIVSVQVYCEKVFSASTIGAQEHIPSEEAGTPTQAAGYGGTSGSATRIGGIRGCRLKAVIQRSCPIAGEVRDETVTRCPHKTKKIRLRGENHSRHRCSMMMASFCISLVNPRAPVSRFGIEMSMLDETSARL
ncbi:uncharacterized protein BYT42DRAFT_545472 [Radiomyces spectabilis]|uniref:uncharacterized protein n=1 Tax=Radiomyces spectabilis TaxID=64574 RepID=UPI00221EA7C0|nr:uncharacterized protein BYT42DRAFT_545472 [Radiomyces spectabilis]KAI8381613.1 hypothetical protein BYT42DRAFT_545472 [Radiomyces spectabilis]